MPIEVPVDPRDLLIDRLRVLARASAPRGSGRGSPRCRRARADGGRTRTAQPRARSSTARCRCGPQRRPVFRPSRRSPPSCRSRRPARRSSPPGPNRSPRGRSRSSPRRGYTTRAPRCAGSFTRLGSTAHAVVRRARRRGRQGTRARRERFEDAFGARARRRPPQTGHARRRLPRARAARHPGQVHLRRRRLRSRRRDPRRAGRTLHAIPRPAAQNVPPPSGSKAADMAEHFIGEFFAVFDELGIYAERYRMRDVYRSGAFDEVDRSQPSPARRRRPPDLQKKSSGSEKGADWFHSRSSRKNCGRIGTTDVRATTAKRSPTPASRTW